MKRLRHICCILRCGQDIQLSLSDGRLQVEASNTVLRGGAADRNSSNLPGICIVQPRIHSTFTPARWFFETSNADVGPNVVGLDFRMLRAASKVIAWRVSS